MLMHQDLKPCASGRRRNEPKEIDAQVSTVKAETTTPDMSRHRSGRLAVGLKSRRCDLEVKFRVAAQLCTTMSDDYDCIEQILIISTLKGS